MDLGRLRASERVVAGTGVALVVDLLLLPWHSYTFADVRVRWQAVDEPNRFFGVVSVLLTIVIVSIVLARALDVTLPHLPVRWGEVLFYASTAVVVFLFLKLLQETSALAYGSWLALVLAATMTYGAWLERRFDAAA